jgi:hypothetical protein
MKSWGSLGVETILGSARDKEVHVLWLVDWIASGFLERLVRPQSVPCFLSSPHPPSPDSKILEEGKVGR